MSPLKYKTQNRCGLKGAVSSDNVLFPILRRASYYVQLVMIHGVGPPPYLYSSFIQRQISHRSSCVVTVASNTARHLRYHMPCQNAQWQCKLDVLFVPKNAQKCPHYPKNGNAAHVLLPVRQTCHSCLPVRFSFIRGPSGFHGKMAQHGV